MPEKDNEKFCFYSEGINRKEDYGRIMAIRHGERKVSSLRKRKSVTGL